ncbi:MAG: NAD-dependent epimerase/dehydratase family protein [Dehalococcoidia bacterium]
MGPGSRVLVTGGAGYVGAVLVPKLIAAGYLVTVLDLYLYGEPLASDPRLRQVHGDMRDAEAIRQAVQDVDAIIHLACISNDPSFELDPELGKSINYDAMALLIEEAKRVPNMRRFVFASSSSVYGVKEEPDVTEELSLEPLTDYSKYKALGEELLLERAPAEWTSVILRPATVCGYSPRLRLDLVVNILTNHAVNKGAITVFGGGQMRPNIHIDDVTDLYVQALTWPHALVDREVFNAGYDNLTVMEIAELVRKVVGPHVTITSTPTDDNRSYQVSSAKIARVLGFQPRKTVEDAVRDLVTAFNGGHVPNPLDDDVYYNIRRMQRVGLK